MTGAPTTVSLGVAGGVARVVLERPQVGNAIDLQMAHDLRDAARACNSAPGLRVVLFSGRGASFCVGGDLRASAASGRAPADYSAEITTVLHEAIMGFARLPVPVVVLLHGVTAGAGIGLAAMADLVIAARSSTLVAAYTKVSLTPDAGVSFLLPRLIGVQRTMELLLTNRPLGAEEARQWGLVNRVVDDPDLGRVADELVEDLRRGPAGAYAETKALVRGALDGLEAHLAAESRCMARQVATAEGAAGVAAFLTDRGRKS